MKRADALWQYFPIAGTFADYTQALGDGTGSVTLSQNEKLYIGSKDWLSGLFFQIDSAPSGTPSIVVETFDGVTGLWKTLPVQERFDQFSSGHAITSVGYDFRSSGMVYWGSSPFLWTLKTAARGFPEVQLPPGTPELYWVRLRNATVTTVTIDRVLPVMYNTYATVAEVAEFIGLPGGFDENSDPTETFVRHRIRAAEDWLDDYTRKSWRLKLAMNERNTFNPHGMRLKKQPVWYVQRFGYWAGGSLQLLNEGREQDWYISPDTGMIYFTRVVFGRGINWMTTSPRYLRQAESTEIDYIYGEDFEISDRRGIVNDLILKRVGSDLVNQMDWTSMFINNPDAVPKPEKARAWREEVEAVADQLRGVRIT